MADRGRTDYGTETVTWRWRDIALSVVLLGTLGTVATVTVVGGGGLLLLFSPLLLLFSPILVPLGIFLAVSTGGIVAFLGFIGTLVWVYRYWKGERPIGGEYVDAATGKVKQTTSYFADKASDLTGYGQHKAGETYGRLSDKVSGAA